MNGQVQTHIKNDINNQVQIDNKSMRKRCSTNDTKILEIFENGSQKGSKLNTRRGHGGEVVVGGF